MDLISVCHQVFKNMKKNILLFNIIFLLSACDIEDKPYINDYNSYINPNKKVLIEDFTGHLCPNCPEAAREIEAIHDIYGNQVIAIAIHVSSSFARPYPTSAAPKFQYDFRTLWGDNWDDEFGISQLGLPRGMVNRIGYINDAHQMGKDQWATNVASELKKNIDFSINLAATDTNISCDVNIINNINNNYYMVVCLTENQIVNWQKDLQLEIEEYIHNHVLRTVIYDGPISDIENFVKDEIINKEFVINLNALEQMNVDYSTNTADYGNGNAGGWNSDNMYAVAFIYNTTTKEVVQVEETKLN